MAEAIDFGAVCPNTGQELILVCADKKCGASAFISALNNRRNMHTHQDKPFKQNWNGTDAPLQRALEAKRLLTLLEGSTKAKWKEDIKKSKALATLFNSLVEELRTRRRQRNTIWVTLEKMVGGRYSEVSGSDMADLVEAFTE